MEVDNEVKDETPVVSWDNYYRGLTEAPKSEFSSYIESCSDFEKIEKG